MTKKVFLVFDKVSGEGVVFSNREDAEYAATGVAETRMLSAIAEHWRECYGWEEEYDADRVVFPVIELEIFPSLMLDQEPAQND